MNKCPDSSQEKDPEGAAEPHEVQGLEFPIDRHFLSLPPRLDPQAMLRRIEQTLPWRATRPGEQARRDAMEIDAECVL